MTFDFSSLPQHWVNRLGFLLHKSLTEEFRQSGENVSAEEWAILLMLWQKDGRFPGELADLTIRDRTTMTRLLDGMARKGFINRQTDTRDRRRMVVNLTAKGRDLRNTLIPIARKIISTSNHEISEQDLDTTARTLQKMSQNLLQRKES